MNSFDGLKRTRYWMKAKMTWLTVPISGGPLKGYRFGLFTGTRFLKGIYGPTERDVLINRLQPGNVVFDVGAHIGYFSLLASHLIGQGGNTEGKVYAFEPLPLNVAYLKGHLRINRIGNVTVFPAAVGLKDSWMSLDLGGGSGRSSLTTRTDKKHLRVQVVCLDSLLADGKITPPDFIKMDIEGAEAQALRGARKTLHTSHPTILLSVHGQSVQKECESFLHEIGYRWSYIMRSTLLAQHSEK